MTAGIPSVKERERVNTRLWQAQRYSAMYMNRADKVQTEYGRATLSL